MVRCKFLKKPTAKKDGTGRKSPKIQSVLEKDTKSQLAEGILAGHWSAKALTSDGIFEESSALEGENARRELLFRQFSPIFQSLKGGFLKASETTHPVESLSILVYLYTTVKSVTADYLIFITVTNRNIKDLAPFDYLGHAMFMTHLRRAIEKQW